MRQSAESRIFVPKSIENKQIIQQNMKIALIGYGKMGHMIEDIAKKRGHEIVSIIDVNNVNDFTKRNCYILTSNRVNNQNY